MYTMLVVQAYTAHQDFFLCVFSLLLIIMWWVWMDDRYFYVVFTLFQSYHNNEPKSGEGKALTLDLLHHKLLTKSLHQHWPLNFV